MDRRIKYTKKIIKDTFLELMDEKDIKKITVSEICKICDINRATFYRYYLDVYDLLDKIEEEFVNELKETSENNIKDDYTVGSFAKVFLNVFVDNKKLVKLLFESKSTTHLLNDILEIAYIKCKEKWEKDLPNLKEEDVEYAAIFIFNGALGAINFWVKNDFDKDPNEIADIIEKLSNYGTKRFIYKK